MIKYFDASLKSINSMHLSENMKNLLTAFCIPMLLAELQMTHEVQKILKRLKRS